MAFGDLRALHQRIVKEHRHEHLKHFDQRQHDREQAKLGRGQQVRVDDERTQRDQRQPAIFDQAPDR